MGHIRYAAHVVTGTATGVAAGSAVNGNALMVGGSLEKCDISSLVTVDAETNTITLGASWQVGNDDSTWFDVANAPQNPASVVLATGTAGADDAVTKAVGAPDAVYGFKFARSNVDVGVTTGTDNDTYSIAYSYRQLDNGERQQSQLKFNSSIVTGTATGVASGGQVNGAALHMNSAQPKVRHLSALVTVEAETDTITLGAKWQGSNDGSTWVNVAYAPHNPAAVPLATGTAGDDAVVTKVVPAPAAVYGYKYSRCAVEVGGTTGAATDTYSIAYNYRQMAPGAQIL